MYKFISIWLVFFYGVECRAQQLFQQQYAVNGYNCSGPFLAAKSRDRKLVLASTIIGPSGWQTPVLFKINPEDGSLLWARKPVTDNMHAQVTSLIVGASGELLISGVYRTSAFAENFCFVMLFNQDGTIKWGNLINRPASAERIKAVFLNDNSVVLGFSPADNPDLVSVCKFGNNGSREWIRNMRSGAGALNQPGNYFRDIVPAPSGGFVLCTENHSGTENRKVGLAACSVSGDIIESFNLKTVTENDLSSSSFIMNDQHEYIVALRLQHALCAVKLLSNKEIAWQSNPVSIGFSLLNHTIIEGTPGRYFLYGVNETDDEGFTGLTILQLDSMVTGRSATRQIPEHVLNNWNAPAVLLDNQLFLAATNSNGPKPLMMELVKADTEFNSCCTLSPSLFQQSFPSLQVVPYWVNMGPDDHSPDITYLILLTEDVQVDTSLVCTTKPIRCKKALNLGADTVLCTDTFFRIEAPRYGGYRYLWSTSDTATHITVNKSGMVSVIVFPPDSSGCDTLYDSIRITFHKPADPEIITGELFLWPGEISSFALEAGSYDSLKWYINNVEQIPSTPFSYMFPHNGIYHIKVQAWSEQCMVSDSLTITVDGYSLYIPDIFTPNNDGINELFEPRGKGLESYTLSIYNMWGGLVHASRNSGWNGKGCADGSYVYLLEALDGKGRPRFVNGKVTLVR